jgi:hypothetical protein
MTYFKDTENNIHFLSDEDIKNGGMGFLPTGAVAIDDEAAKNLEQSIDNSVDAQYRAIDAYVLAFIKALPYDYDDVSDIKNWFTDGDYGAESRQLHGWALSCQKVQFNLKMGTIPPYPSVEDAIAALPVFNPEAL